MSISNEKFIYSSHLSPHPTLALCFP